MAHWAVEEDGKVIAFPESVGNERPGGYDEPRFTITKLPRKPRDDEEFVSGKLVKRGDASDLADARVRRAIGMEERVATLEDQVADLMTQIAQLKPAQG